MATHTKETLLKLVEKIRYDTSAIQMNVSELARAIAALPIPEPKPGQHKCPHDQLTFPSHARLAEHLQNVHDITTYEQGTAQIEDANIAHPTITRSSEVAFSHAHTAKAEPSSAGSDVSKLTCREEEVGE